MKPPKGNHPSPLIAALILAALAGCRGAAEPVVVGTVSLTAGVHTATQVFTPTLALIQINL
jgi:hypothetical protein